MSEGSLDDAAQTLAVDSRAKRRITKKWREVEALRVEAANARKAHEHAKRELNALLRLTSLQEG